MRGHRHGQPGPRIRPHGEALPQHQSTRSGTLNPSQAQGQGSWRSEKDRPHLCSWHSEDDSKGVYRVRGEETGGSPPPHPTTTTTVGPQGSVLGPTVKAGPAYTKPRPSALGDRVSPGAGQTLRTVPPAQRRSVAWINSRSLLDIDIYLAHPPISPPHLFPPPGWLLWLLVCLNRHI